MIYFDNAATTKKKPQCVLDAFTYYVTEIGVSPGRGSYKLGIDASRMLYKTRSAIAAYFGNPEPNTIFSKNSTEAINLFLKGFLKEGDHVVISPYEHNAVLRPLETMKQEGLIEYSIIDREDLLYDAIEIVKKYYKKNTVLLAMTLASNLTGRVIFNRQLYKITKDMGIGTFVDASQGAGKIRIDMLGDGIDYLAFTGHKDLKGLPGVGGLCSVDKLGFKPLIQGGTGILGHEKINPAVYPEGYEAGTLNMPAIWSLKAATEYTLEKFSENQAVEEALNDYLVKKMMSLNNVILYDVEYERVDTLGFNVKGYTSNEVVEFLDKKDICVRGGIHCAIIAHEALGTTNIGMVRVSLCETNTIEEIDTFVAIIDEMGEKKCM